MRLYATLSERIALALSVMCGAVALATWSYVTFGMAVNETAFGEKWMAVEIVLMPIPRFFVPGLPVDTVLQMKPATLFSYSVFLFWAFGMESLRTLFKRVPLGVRRSMLIIAAFFAFLSFYEVLWNFSAWGAKFQALMLADEFASDRQADLLTFDNPYYQVNILFVGKMFTTLLSISLYSVYFLHSLGRPEA